MVPNDYHIHIPVGERKELMDKLEGYRIWEYDTDEETLMLQGHPGMCEVLKEIQSHPFDECFTGGARDLWVGYGLVGGEWVEYLECDEHWNGGGYRTITVEEFNEALENLHEEDWVYEG